MKKLIFIGILFIFACVMAFLTKDTYVYIEKDVPSDVFHYNKDCSTIDNHIMKKVTLVDAKRLEKKVCKAEKND
jgi:phosphoribosylpyrophosphate synthetase